MLSRNCTEALSIQANVMISCSSAKLIKNGSAPLPVPLPALLQQYWYVKRGERVRVRGHAQFYATLGFTVAIQMDERFGGADPCLPSAPVRAAFILLPPDPFTFLTQLPQH